MLSPLTFINLRNGEISFVYTEPTESLQKNKARVDNVLVSKKSRAAPALYSNLMYLPVGLRTVAWVVTSREHTSSSRCLFPSKHRHLNLGCNGQTPNPPQIR